MVLAPAAIVRRFGSVKSLTNQQTCKCHAEEHIDVYWSLSQSHCSNLAVYNFSKSGQVIPNKLADNNKSFKKRYENM